MMTDPKRSATPSSVGKCNGKLKELLSSSPHQSEDVPQPQVDLTNIPIIRQADNARLLPKYTTSQVGDAGVSMDDLDLLQKDLEKLLSTSIIRIRNFLSEIEEMDGNDDTHERKAHDKTCMKRKQPDEKTKFKDLKKGMKVLKKNYGLPVNKLITDPQHILQELPKVTLFENGTSDKFWASIESYCTNVNKDDVTFLDRLIKEFSDDVDVKIPDVGEHYANNWMEDIIND